MSTDYAPPIPYANVGLATTEALERRRARLEDDGRETSLTELLELGRIRSELEERARP